MTFAGTMRMAARQAWQGWRNGEFGVLLAALFVAVLALAGVGSIAQRTTDALAEQSRRLVGGGRAGDSSSQIRRERLIAAAARALASFIADGVLSPPRVARVISFHARSDGLPPDEVVRAFDISLTCYAEHSFNASTFAARVIAGVAVGRAEG